MASLNDIINLSKADGGKFFVIDENGDVKLVIMNVEDYERILLGKLQRQVLDVENINKEILKVQLQETEVVTPVVEVPKAEAPKIPLKKHSFEDDLGYSAESLQGNGLRARVDLREEVIDPSFDFEAPKTEIDDL